MANEETLDLESQLRIDKALMARMKDWLSRKRDSILCQRVELARQGHRYWSRIAPQSFGDLSEEEIARVRQDCEAMAKRAEKEIEIALADVRANREREESSQSSE